MTIVYKIFAIFIKKRLNEIMERIVGDFQWGFRKGRSVLDRIHVLRRI